LLLGNRTGDGLLLRRQFIIPAQDLFLMDSDLRRGAVGGFHGTGDAVAGFGIGIVVGGGGLGVVFAGRRAVALEGGEEFLGVGVSGGLGASLGLFLGLLLDGHDLGLLGAALDD